MTTPEDRQAPESTESARPATLPASQPSQVLGEGSASSGAREAELQAEVARLRADADALAKVVRDAQAHTARRGGKSAAWEALTEILHRDSGGPIQRYEARARARIVASLTPGYKESVVSPADPERNYKAERDRLREAVRRVEALLACQSTGCPCGGDRASVPSRDVRAILADAAPDPTPNTGEPTNQRLACAYGGHDWVRGISSLASRRMWTRVCVSCGASYAVSKDEFDRLPAASSADDKAGER